MRLSLRPSPTRDQEPVSGSRLRRGCLAVALAVATAGCGAERKAVQLLELGSALVVPVASLGSEVDPGSAGSPGADRMELEYRTRPVASEAGELTALVAYTTPQLLQPGSPFRTMSVTQTLELVRDDPEIQAIVLNPESHPAGVPFLDEAGIARYLESHPRQGDLPWAIEVRQ
jgi:hypothetical protein